VCCLLADDLHDGRWAEVELVEQEGVRVDGFQSQRAERGGGEITRVRGDDGLRAAVQRCRDDVPVVPVRQADPAFEPFPSGDQRIFERFADVSESFTGIGGFGLSA
jgi:hypothetical protein